MNALFSLDPLGSGSDVFRKDTRFALARKQSQGRLGIMLVKAPKPRRKRASSQLQHELKLVSSCPVMASLTLLRGRWKLPLVWRLREAATPMAELRRTFTIASEKMLSQHLGELVRDGFVTREAEGTHLTVKYRLTPLGQSLLPVLESLRVWGTSEGAVPRAIATLKETSE